MGDRKKHQTSADQPMVEKPAKALEGNKDSEKHQTPADQPTGEKPAEGTGDSKKHQRFVVESMDDKLATKLPGIGPEHGERLDKAGFNKAYKVFAKYLILDKDEEKFKRWLFYKAGANKKDQDQCYRCLRDWCANFFK